ncbi:MAG: glycosyltransferase family 2 protein [Lentisphaeria bacterium]|nr:glycosyltransferase family 2 protein [Lentisphaeria bacterium]
MNNSVNLSIIISCHSKTPYFQEMLDSLLSCGYHFNNTEILICDDASPAGGDGETARIYASRYPRLIKCIRNEKNIGVSRSYNTLVSMAQGRYIMPFDSDDVFVKFDIDGAISELDEHPEWCASYGKKLLFSAKDGYMGSSHGGDYSPFALLLDPRMTHIGMIIRASDLKNTRGYMLPGGAVCKVADDVCMWSAICAAKIMHFKNEVRGLYRIHSGQETSLKARLFAEAYETCRDTFLAENNTVANKIRCDAPFQLSEKEVIPAVVTAGIKFIRSKNPQERMGYLNIASQLMPFDYGIDEYRIKEYLAANDRDNAVRYALAMLANHSGKPYVVNVALGLARQACTGNKMLEQRLSLAHQNALQEFFTLSPEIKEQLNKSVARFQNQRF